MGELAVTVIGADTPGIIARVSGVLHDHGGNLEDSSSTILGGQFAMMLLVDTEVDPADLEAGVGHTRPRPDGQRAAGRLRRPGGPRDPCAQRLRR